MNDVQTIEFTTGLDVAAGEADGAESSHIEERDEAVAQLSLQPLYRDPADVRTILSMAWTGTLLVLLLLASVAFNIWQYWRRPDRIVVDRSSGRVLMINDREYGETEAVKLGPDKLTNADKQYLSGEFVKAIFGVDPATRPRDIERALRMMAPASALLFARHLKQIGILDKQRSESWQAVWAPQDISVDGTDPYTVRVKGTDHFLVMRAGSGFASPAIMANARRAPVTSIIAQMQSGLVVTFLFYPVQQIAEQAHRVVITYDRNEVIAARRAAGLAVNLDGPEEERSRTTSMRVSTPLQNETASVHARMPSAPKLVADTAEIDTTQPSVKSDIKISDPSRIASLALTEATRSPRDFKKWNDSVHGLSLSVTPVQDVGRNSQLVVIAARNTKKTDARIVSGQPDIYLETHDGKGRPLQVEPVRKLAAETTATDGVIPAGETRYYALVYEAQILGVRQRLRAVVGQTTSADEPSSANLTSSKR